MKWSKIKKNFEEQLAPVLKGRVQVHVTEYTKILHGYRSRLDYSRW